MEKATQGDAASDEGEEESKVDEDPLDNDRFYQSKTQLELDRNVTRRKRKNNTL